MFNPTKEKIFKNPAYRKLTAALADQYKKRVKLIDSCPDCKAIVGLNAFGFLVTTDEKPEAVVMSCRECEHLFVGPVFV